MPSLSEADRHALLRLARHAVVEAVSHGRLPEQIPNEGVFAERHGVFVTLHVRHRLRGCIGVIEGEDRLSESIVRCSVSAALHDPRFAPLRAEELDELQIEISLLAPPAPIRPEDIEIGRHGLLVAREKQRGLLLPQVAVEHRLATEQFLRETCRKAQLAQDAWREPETQIFGFTCEVFSDEQAPPNREF
jgi:AmmeMemoRadiSam system protein A